MLWRFGIDIRRTITSRVARIKADSSWVELVITTFLRSMAGLWCVIVVFLLYHLSVHTCGSSRARGTEDSLLDAGTPTGFPTAFYEQGLLGKEWWFVVQATIVFAGNVDSNPNDAADYALTFTLQDRLRHVPEVSVEVLEVDIIRTSM